MNQRWLGANERKEMIEVYADYIAVLDAQYPDVDDLANAGMLEDYFEKRTELERLERIDRCDGDLIAFAYEYFGDVLNPGNVGNWIPIQLRDAPEFHREICSILDDVNTKEPNARIAVAAPRGHAKSSFISRAFVLSNVVYRRQSYIVMISETPAVSTTNLEWLSLQLKSNEKLRNDFGPLLSPRDQANPKDNSSEFVTWIDDGREGKALITKVEAASTGQALRGKNFLGNRPSIIADDLESTKNTNTNDLREDLKKWWTSVVEPIGDPAGKKTFIILMGTTVHESSLIMDLIHRRSDYKTQKYKALITEPTRGELWEECRQLYLDFSDPDRATKAEQFYADNFEEMNEGAKVLWKDVQPLWKLMTWKWSNGSRAFNTEYQNEPLDKESAIFVPENFTYWDDTQPNREFPHSEYDISLSTDFAMGKARGDFSAVAVIAKSKKTDEYFVVDSYIERVIPDKFLDVVVAMTMHWQPDVIAGEAVAAQEYWVDNLKAKLTRAGYPANTRVKKIYHRTRKELRIESLTTPIENGQLQFARKFSPLLTQFELYPTTFDDGPDSVSMAFDALKDSEAVVTTVRRMNRW